MSNTAAEFSAISVLEPLQQKASDRTLLAHDRSTATPFEPVAGQEFATAIKEGNEPENTSEGSTQRWRALDRLLRVSFGRISPAYLFESFL